mmetsp:Transcript_122596/g.308201  ORF Transcript_122596/g.308201 Transcript_122596/m.308201 type:complete len:509 (-) Transcript_122596:88-1614(-)
MDILGGGVDLTRKEIEAIVAGGAKETADRVALLCALRSQAALEEERRVLRATGASTPISPLSRSDHDPSPKNGDTSSRYATKAWTRGFYDRKLQGMFPPPAPREEAEPLGRRQDQGEIYDCAGILRSAYSIKGKVHDALTTGRRAAAAAPLSERQAPGEALRSSTCNMRSVVRMCSHIFQQGSPEAAAAGRPSAASASTSARATSAAVASASSRSAAAVAAPAEQREETPSEAAARVRAALGGRGASPCVVVCVLGGTDFRTAEARALVEALAAKLDAVAGSKVRFVTGGMAGVHETFAKSCGDGSRVWNLLPVGHSSGFGRGTDINAGRSLDERKAIFGLLGDVYLTVEGGPALAQEAQVAYERGATVVPLRRTGGASDGLFGFPAGALQRPPFASEVQWALLASKDASVDESAAAAAAVVEACVAAAVAAKESAGDVLPVLEEVPPLAAAAAPAKESPRIATGDIEKQRAQNEELSRALLELTAELQRHNIISGDASVELPAKTAP